MNRWYKSTSGPGLTIAGRLAALGFVALIFAIFYLVFQHDPQSLSRIPAPMTLITIAVPALLSGLIFWFARILERHNWQLDDE